jgi:hypothetical protein
MTTSPEVLKRLQKCLEEFLADHRKNAPLPPDKESEESSEDEGVGCGCQDCQTAGFLLGNIR